MCDNCINFAIQVAKLKDELKYQKYLLAEYKTQKKKLEPTVVKEYLTVQKNNGRRTKRTQKTKVLAPAYHEKKSLRKELIDLINDYDDVDVMKAIKEVITSHSELEPFGLSLTPPNSPYQSPPVLVLDSHFVPKLSDEKQQV